MAVTQRLNLTCLLATLTFIVSMSASATAETRIVGGTPITISQAPYTMQFRYKSNGWISCTGTLVAARFVVTAAHCFDGLHFRDIVVVGGVSTLSEPGVERNIVDMIIHPEYDSMLNSDLAILKLDSDMKGEKIHTVPLCNRRPQAGNLIQVTGWGLTADKGEMSHQLRTVYLPIIPQNECDQQHRGSTKNGICAFIPATKSACNGDSGGPAIFGGELCGVVSFGRDCGSKYYSSVFVDVYKLRNFIKDFMKK